MGLIKLEWDSEFFDYPIAKVVVDDIKSFNFEEFVEEASNYKLVYVFSKEEFVDHRFKLVDKKAVYSQDISLVTDTFNQGAFLQTFDAGNQDLDQLIMLALESGIYSRFHVDPNFRNNEYEKLYKQWILNSVNGEIAFDVQVYTESDRLLGFSTLSRLSNEIADIGLVAVDKVARGRGIGTQLITEIIRRAAAHNFSEIQVVTQGTNIPAVNLYLKNGFNLKNITNIYHYWNL